MTAAELALMAFQSTLPRRERPGLVSRLTESPLFQSTLPRRERPGIPQLLRKNQCFNPRSHEGSDTYDFKSASPWHVSIHAPTKGATILECSIHAAAMCFNPRSHEGSDYGRVDIIVLGKLFQSTLPRRERRRHEQTVKPGYHVSIHAPTKGATAISAKNSFQFSAEINKLSFYILNFPLFPSPLFLHSTSFVHILECESPGIFMCTSYSHSYIITKYIICCNSTIGTFFCFIYKSAPFL